ncbi:EspA/EspE family type VII secretion system effector [Mycobacterium sp. Aquia_213]|uniref:EspA/EspE family type VII secretion system effector n=1 Tax=Mycobacterium sp. Aquia_213 TaxID=2991728 RepID=UPI00226DDFEF|nr:EspA/EspE family type VII secretion system effector [Mycobacterium sp. Aquia_213]WAC89315.1 EspA/EspE family type VII secretion system effector [Mycobacterium sp. Aquia_213]
MRDKQIQRVREGYVGMDAETMLAVAKAIANATTGVKNLGDGDRVGAAASFTAAAQNVLQELVKAWGTETAKSMLKVKPTLVLENAIAMTGLVELVNGWSVPEKGSVLNDASKLNFQLALEKLKTAMPDPQHWSGKAALGYGHVNKEIQACVQEVIAADAQLQVWMQAQSEQVLYTRRAFSYTKTGLVACLPVAWGIYLYTFSSLASNPFTAAMALNGALTATRVFQYGVSVGALGTLIGFASDHMITVSSMSQFDAVAGKYDAARSRLFIPETAPPLQAAPTSTGTTVRSFGSPSGAGGNFPATSSRPYPVAGSKPYPVAGRTGSYVAGPTNEPVHAPATPDPRPEPNTPATPSQPATPFTPAATPAASAMAQPAGQGSQGAGRGVQKKATTEESAPGDDAVGAAAAVGAEGAERAPIEAAAVRPEQPSTRSTP